MELTGKKIAVLGCGRSGVAAARLALTKGAAVFYILNISGLKSVSVKQQYQ